MQISKINESDQSVVRERVYSGVKKMNDLVSMTLGPNGKSVLIERGTAEPLIVDDGRRVAENIKFDDPIEHLAVRVLYGVTRKTDEKAGDGTTTSMVLAHALLKDIFENHLTYGGIIGGNASVSDIDNAIQKAKTEVVERLAKMAKPVNTEKELVNVATVSSGDEKIGAIIGGMYNRLGKDGHITLEFNLLSDEIETEVVPGMRFLGGYAERWMRTNAERDEAVFQDVHVLVAQRKDLDAESIKGVAKEVASSGKSCLVIIAQKFTPDFLKSVYLTAKKSKFDILCVRAPGLHSEHYQDIAIWTGARLFTDKDNIAEATKEDLGYVEKIEATEDSCMLIQGRGNGVLIKKRIKEVKAEAAQQKAYQLKAQRLERASALSGGVGVIKIGAPTDEERTWLKYKIEDAKYATKVAYQYGIVPGAGQAYKKIADSLPDNNILKKALLAPWEKLKENSSGKLEVKGIFDPMWVERWALENACSAVSKLIRIGGAIANKRQEPLDRAFKRLIGDTTSSDEDEDGED